MSLIASCTTIAHHPSDELMADYASGALSEGWSLAVASHISVCPACRKRLAVLEQLGGELLEGFKAEPVDDRSWEAVRARLFTEQRADRLETPRRAKAAEPGDVPAPLRRYIGTDLQAVRWKRLGVGAFQLILATKDPSTTVRLLRIPAGKSVPEHGHDGNELTLVLKGRFHDGDALFGVGDIEEVGPDHEHQPVAGEGEECICLAITDAPLRFRNRLVRLVQPLLGI